MGLNGRRERRFGGGFSGIGGQVSGFGGGRLAVWEVEIGTALAGLGSGLELWRWIIWYGCGKG